MSKKSPDSLLGQLFREKTPGAPAGKVRTTSFICDICDVPLCKKFCFLQYHEVEEPEE
jgi:hypothetical protein